MNPDNAAPAAATAPTALPGPGDAAVTTAPVPAPAAPVPASPAAPVDATATAASAPAPAAPVPASPAASLDAAATAAPALPVDGVAPAAAQVAPLAAATPPDAGAPIEAMSQAADHSLLGLIIQAGPVVQGVMGALVLASIICWAIMIEKAVLLGRLQREIRLLSNTGDPGAASGDGLAAQMQRAAAREWAEGRDHDESRGEYRERIDRAMRETLAATIRRAQSGTAFLATTGAVGPFVGLFGTVWGIMGSFQGIAQMHDTSLAVVAPGIAEALLATAIGLFAAIPAVIGYNRVARRVAGLRAEALAAISATGARLSGRPPRGGNLARAAE